MMGADEVSLEQEGTMVRTVNLPILSELLGEIPIGRTLLMLVDPDAQTTALFVNAASGHLRAGGDLLYSSINQPVSELRQLFVRGGLNIAEYEAKDSAVLFDAYSAAMGTKSPEKYHAFTSNLNEMSIAMAESASLWPAGTLIVYESLSSMAFGQESVFSKFTRKVISIWRPRGTIVIAAMTTGLHPTSFYQDMKQISDAVVEVKLEEFRGEIVNTIRARSFRGRNADTRVRRVIFDDKMNATTELLKR